MTSDGGQSWEQAAVPASVSLTGVHFPTPDSGWAVGHDGLILHSADGGKTWEKQLDGHQLNEQIISVAERIVEQVRTELEELQADETADPYDVEDAEFMLEEAEFMLEGAMDDTSAGPVRPLLDVWFRDANEGFVVGSYGMLLHTTNGGREWTLVSDRMDNPEAFHLNQIVSAPDGNLYIAGESGKVHRSVDGGMTWDSLEPGYEGSFYGVVVAPGDGVLAVLFAVFRGCGHGLDLCFGQATKLILSDEGDVALFVRKNVVAEVGVKLGEALVDVGVALLGVALERSTVAREAVVGQQHEALLVGSQ